MSGSQKGILVAALVLLGVTTLVAPHDYVGYNELAWLRDGGPRSDHRVAGTAFAPVWSDPDHAKLRHGSLPPGTDGWLEVEESQLATGKLGLMWGGVAAVTLVGILLLSPSRTPHE